jgi:hypothetical protein
MPNDTEFALSLFDNTALTGWPAMSRVWGRRSRCRVNWTRNSPSLARSRRTWPALRA